MNEAQGLADTFTKLAEADVLTWQYRALAAEICQVAGFSRQDTELAVGLALVATAAGSVCVEIDAVAGQFPITDVQWPDAQTWRESLEREIANAGTVSPLVLEGNRLYLDRYRRHEKSLATQLISRRAAPDEPLSGDLEEQLLTLFSDSKDPANDRQLLAVRTVASRNLTVIAGGPGTGKTTTIAKAFAMLTEQHRQAGHTADIALAAPTGRAAARLKESIQQLAPTVGADDDIRQLMHEARPTTLHRLLGWQPGNRSRFRYNAENPLPFDAVIVDECSMVSLAMMDQLVDALAPSAKLVLVGDPQQLASVEAGSAFGDIVGDVSHSADDLLARGVVVLNRTHRFGDEIYQLAEAVLAGNAEQVCDLLASEPRGIHWVPTPADQLTEAQRYGLLEPATGHWRKLREQAFTFGEGLVSQLSSARILCGPRQGSFGVSTWNRIAFAQVLDDLRSGSVDTWFPGRIVLASKNDQQLDVFNGDVGVALANANGEVDRVMFDRGGEPFIVAANRLEDVQTAYASTVHKSQGSQFRHVVVVLPPAESRLMTRELLYTAITRAQESVTIVGDRAGISTAVTNRTGRRSGLREALAVQ